MRCADCHVFGACEGSGCGVNDDADELAVEFIVNGTRMKVAKDKATLRAAVLRIGAMRPVVEVAYLCGTYADRVTRLLRETGVRCPSCKRWVPPGGDVLPEHVNTNGLVCPMSGFAADDTDRLELVRRMHRVLERNPSAGTGKRIKYRERAVG